MIVKKRKALEELVNGDLFVIKGISVISSVHAVKQNLLYIQQIPLCMFT